MKQSKADKELDKAISKAWAIVGSGVQVNMMDIPKIFREAKVLILNGETVTNACGAMVDKYKLN